MTNFKQETLERIGEHKVAEYKLEYVRDWSLSENPTYMGSGEIKWDAVTKSELTYDSGYGCQYWRGWITFKDTPDWLERQEYDGSEWWAWRSKPSLEKEREKEERLNDKNI